MMSVKMTVYTKAGGKIEGVEATLKDFVEGGDDEAYTHFGGRPETEDDVVHLFETLAEWVVGGEMPDGITMKFLSLETLRGRFAIRCSEVESVLTSKGER